MPLITRLYQKIKGNRNEVARWMRWAMIACWMFSTYLIAMLILALLALLGLVTI